MSGLWELLSQISNDYYLCFCFICNVRVMFDLSLLTCCSCELLVVSGAFLTIPLATDSLSTSTGSKLQSRCISTQVPQLHGSSADLANFCFSSGSIVKGLRKFANKLPVGKLSVFHVSAQHSHLLGMPEQTDVRPDKFFLWFRLRNNKSCHDTLQNDECSIVDLGTPKPMPCRGRSKWLRISMNKIKIFLYKKKCSKNCGFLAT